MRVRYVVDIAKEVEQYTFGPVPPSALKELISKVYNIPEELISIYALPEKGRVEFRENGFDIPNFCSVGFPNIATKK